MILNVTMKIISRCLGWRVANFSYNIFTMQHAWYKKNSLSMKQMQVEHETVLLERLSVFLQLYYQPMAQDSEGTWISVNNMYRFPKSSFVWCSHECDYSGWYYAMFCFHVTCCVIRFCFGPAKTLNVSNNDNRITLLIKKKIPRCLWLTLSGPSAESYKKDPSILLNHCLNNRKMRYKA